MTNTANPETDSALPAGWKWARLGELAKLVRGVSYTKKDEVQDDGHKVLRANNIAKERARLDLSEIKYVSDSLQFPPDKKLLKDDIFICLASGSKDHIGKVALMADDTDYYFGAFMGAIRVDHRQICPTYLFHQLQHSRFNHFLRSQIASTNINNLSAKVLYRFPIPLPPLSEQKRIARVLDECLALVARAKDAAELQLEAAVALPGAYLRQALPAEGDDLPAGWKWARLGEVCEIVSGYGFKVMLQGRKGLPYPFIKVSDMNADGAEKVVSTASNTVDSSILKQLKAKTFPIGTVIFPKVGAALLTNKRRILGAEATFDNNVMGLIPKDVSSIWVYYWMLTIDLSLLSNIQALPSVRKSDIKAIPIPLPPLDEQRRIASDLDARISVAGTLVSRIRDQLDAIDALPGAYLRKAFAGEI